MLQKLLVTLDGSQLSEAAIPVAERIVSGTGAKIDIMTVVKRPQSRVRVERIHSIPEPGLYGGFVRAEVETIESQDEAEQRVTSRLKRYMSEKTLVLTVSGVDVAPSVAFDDDPVRAIVNHARDANVDLIVMATHGRSGLGETIFGSVAHDVLKSGIAPVVLVRPERRQHTLEPWRTKLILRVRHLKGGT